MRNSARNFVINHNFFFFCSKKNKAESEEQCSTTYREKILATIAAIIIGVLSSFLLVYGGISLLVSEKNDICFQKDDRGIDNIVFLL